VSFIFAYVSMISMQCALCVCVYVCARAVHMYTVHLCMHVCAC